MDEHPDLPTIRIPQPVAVSRPGPSVPMPTTIIPAVKKRPVQRVGVVPLSAAARARGMRLSLLVLVMAGGATLVAFTPLSGWLARPLAPWSANNQVILIPTATPSHPVASGEHDFVCAALPFARLAQQAIVKGPNAQPHPWYVSVILAQWGIEHGWNIPDYTGYNWGNSSALPGFPSVPGTNQVGSPGAFAYATSAEMGVQIYVAFAQNGLYNVVAAAYPQGPEAQAYALGASPWDAAHYTEIGVPGSVIVNVMHTFNLKRLDQPGASC